MRNKINGINLLDISQIEHQKTRFEKTRDINVF